MKIIRKEVGSFGGFEKTVKSFENEIHNKDFTLVFRGECVNELKSQKPSIFVPSIMKPNLVKYEYDLINEIRRVRPIEFDNLSDLDLMGKCRHYGQPSRLLDFTFNKFIALFFATARCEPRSKSSENQSKKECYVYCMATQLRSEKPAETICRIPVKMQPYMYDLQSVAQENQLVYIEDILKGRDEFSEEKVREFIKYTLGDPIFTYPRFYTSREQNQQSVFMLLPNKIIDTSLEDKIDFSSKDWKHKLEATEKILKRFVFIPELYNPITNSLSSNNDERIENRVLIIKINKNAVKGIKEKLAAMNIDEEFLFPDDLEKVVYKITEKIKHKHNIK